MSMLDMPLQSRQWASAPAGITIGQWEQELNELVKIYQECRPESVVEIGSHQGGTLHRWLQEAPCGTQRVLSVDLGPTGWRPAQPNWDLRRWEEWVPAGMELHTLIGNSKDPEMIAKVRELTHGSIGFLFIDGDHSYEGALADFENYGRLVHSGGVIAFHDLITPVGQEHIQIKRLWAEIRQAGYKVQELWSHKGQAWGGIGVVYI